VDAKEGAAVPEVAANTGDKNATANFKVSGDSQSGNQAKAAIRQKNKIPKNPVKKPKVTNPSTDSSQASLAKAVVTGAQSSQPEPSTGGGGQ
jgi:hypothetical protein